MGKSRRAREEAQRKKAKQKKLILKIAGGCIFTVTAVIILIVLLTSGENENKPARARDSAVVDLTVFNATMAHAEAEKILIVEPDNYIGRTIKVSGEYFYQSQTGKHYVIVEGSATCPKAFELKWDSGYLQEGAIITVTGIFESYTEADMTWYRLDVGEMLIKL